MLWRLVAKLMFKACVPLILLAGVLTYGSYLRGGDPGALWKGIAGRASDQVASLFSGMGDDASRAAGALSRGAAAATATRTENGLTQVYTWKDASVVTHYSSAEPAGVSATSVSVDPNVNVLAPISASPQANGPDSGHETTGEPDQRLLALPVRYCPHALLIRAAVTGPPVHRQVRHRTPRSCCACCRLHKNNPCHQSHCAVRQVTDAAAVTQVARFSGMTG